MGADVIGLNCSVGPKTMFDAMEKMRALTTLHLIAQPNAGLPKVVDGRMIYLCNQNTSGIRPPLHSARCTHRGRLLRHYSRTLNGLPPLPDLSAPAAKRNFQDLKKKDEQVENIEIVEIENKSALGAKLAAKNSSLPPN